MGTGANWFVLDDGIPATTEDLGMPPYVAVAPDGTPYLADSGRTAWRSAR